MVCMTGFVQSNDSTEAVNVCQGKPHQKKERKGIKGTFSF